MIQTHGDISRSWTPVQYKDREIREKQGGSEIECEESKLEVEENKSLILFFTV